MDAAFGLQPVIQERPGDEMGDDGRPEGVGAGSGCESCPWRRR